MTYTPISLNRRTVDWVKTLNDLIDDAKQRGLSASEYAIHIYHVHSYDVRSQLYNQEGNDSRFDVYKGWQIIFIEHKDANYGDAPFLAGHPDNSRIKQAIRLLYDYADHTIGYAPFRGKSALQAINLLSVLVDADIGYCKNFHNSIKALNDKYKELP